MLFWNRGGVPQYPPGPDHFSLAMELARQALMRVDYQTGWCGRRSLEGLYAEVKVQMTVVGDPNTLDHGRFETSKPPCSCIDNCSTSGNWFALPKQRRNFSWVGEHKILKVQSVYKAGWGVGPINYFLLENSTAQTVRTIECRDSQEHKGPVSRG